MVPVIQEADPDPAIPAADQAAVIPEAVPAVDLAEADQAAQAENPAEAQILPQIPRQILKTKMPGFSPGFNLLYLNPRV